MSAPHTSASARRPGDKSLAITLFTPRALSIRITASPIGPHPMTTAVSRLRTPLRRTACQATANGSVSAAVSGLSPLGTSIVKGSCTSTRSANAPGAFAESPVICTLPSSWTIGSDTTGVPLAQDFRVPGP